MDTILIDGSQGEGGGQMLRTSLALSMVTGQPMVIENIRARREKSGLLRQHLTAVEAAAKICNADVEGAAIGSKSLVFTPHAVNAGEYHFSVGTAGSATLVLQTILPALLTASAPSRLVLEGGTHNPWAPPYPFLERVYLPLVQRMGPLVKATLERPGFYPAGGGKMLVEVTPAKSLVGFDLLERGAVMRQCAVAMVSNLAKSIALRELAELQESLGWPRDVCHAEEVRAQGPGNVIYATIESEHVTELFIGFGRLGASARKVAEEVVSQVQHYLRAAVPVGPHLADQLLLLLALSAASEPSDAQRGGRFRTTTLTPHSESQIAIFQHFLQISVDVHYDPSGQTCTVNVQPK